MKWLHSAKLSNISKQRQIDDFTVKGRSRNDIQSNGCGA
jgi:hypothetical protein